MPSKPLHSLRAAISITEVRTRGYPNGLATKTVLNDPPDWFWVALIDTSLKDQAARLQVVDFFVEDFIRYHRDRPSLKYVFRELESRIKQYSTLIAVLQEEVIMRKADHEDPIVRAKLTGMVRAIAGYAQFVDLWNTGGVTSVIAAHKDEAYIFQGREYVFCVSLPSRPHSCANSIELSIRHPILIDAAWTSRHFTMSSSSMRIRSGLLLNEVQDAT